MFLFLVGMCGYDGTNEPRAWSINYRWTTTVISFGFSLFDCGHCDGHSSAILSSLTWVYIPFYPFYLKIGPYLMPTLWRATRNKRKVIIKRKKPLSLSFSTWWYFKCPSAAKWFLFIHRLWQGEKRANWAWKIPPPQYLSDGLSLHPQPNDQSAASNQKKMKRWFIVWKSRREHNKKNMDRINSNDMAPTAMMQNQLMIFFLFFPANRIEINREANRAINTLRLERILCVDDLVRIGHPSSSSDLSPMDQHFSDVGRTRRWKMCVCKQETGWSHQIGWLETMCVGS